MLMKYAPQHVVTFSYIQGKDYRTQFQLGNGALFGANYIQVQISLSLSLSHTHTHTHTHTVT